jgi:hypothetical protein
MEDSRNPSVHPFDFEEHERAAVAGYLRQRPFYVDLANVVARILKECINKNHIKVHSVQARAKDATSFGRDARLTVVRKILTLWSSRGTRNWS